MDPSRGLKAAPTQYYDSRTTYFARPRNYDTEQGYGQQFQRAPPFPFDSPTNATDGNYGTIRRQSAILESPTTPQVSTAATAPLPSYRSNPQLIRTSILKDELPMSSRDPHTQHPKAELKIQGTLMSMTEDWTPEEQKAKRRLVEFGRVQSGSVVTTSFRAVSPEERSPDKGCVSCIYCEERDEYVITSVDTIALLELLVAVRFTVEEKNRIRRNLEGYKPLTVSKFNEDTASFYQQIIGYPNPKPRTIEKDVKVFLWSVLEWSLNKIFGKYSVRYGPIDF